MFSFRSNERETNRTRRIYIHTFVAKFLKDHDFHNSTKALSIWNIKKHLIYESVKLLRRLDSCVFISIIYLIIWISEAAPRTVIKFSMQGASEAINRSARICFKEFTKNKKLRQFQNNSNSRSTLLVRHHHQIWLSVPAVPFSTLWLQ